MLTFFSLQPNHTNLNSRQIRPPIYSLKQSKLRKRRVWRYAILYFVMLIIFLVLFVGPIVGGKFITGFTKSINIPLQLLQPTGQDHNDTITSVTGTAADSAAATASSSSGAKLVRLF
jgi:1,3-beta-glucan synthase